MNSKERVLATVTGTKFDKRPFTGTFGLYGARLTNCPLDIYYTDSSKYLTGIDAVVESFNPDILLSPLFLSGIGAAFGSQVEYFTNQAPNLHKPAIKDLRDIPKLKIPDVESNPYLTYTREIVRGLKKKYGDEKLIGAVLASPTELPIMITSLENWLPAVIDNTDDVKKMMDITVPFFLDYTKALISDGADLLAMPVCFTNPNILTRHLIEQYALPVLREAFKDITVPIFMHHTGAIYNEFLDLLTDLPNVAGFVVDSRDILSESRIKAGPKKILMSGIDGSNLDQPTPAEVCDNVFRVLKERHDDPHFILTCTAADVPYNTPLENLKAIPKAIEEYYSKASE